MTSIELHRVSLAYVPGRDILRDFSLKVDEGSFCTLVGPSGSGKTTILRLIAGLEKPSSGRILLGGRAVEHLAPAKRGVAMVFQRPAIYPHLSVRDNLAFSLRLEQSLLHRALAVWTSSAADKAINERVRELAELLGLADALNRLPGSLSGGQQQRLALGRALARKPGVLLLDEPFSQLDAGLRSELRHELRLLQRKLAATVIYVTHDQEEAMTLADQLAVIDLGVLQQVGSPSQVYARPHNRFVAGFVGWPSMHFVDGHLCTRSGMIIWESALGALPAPASWGHDLAGRSPTLTLGIRPEDLVIEADSAAPARSIMKVVLVEMLGYANLVTLERHGWRALARVPAQVCPVLGDEVPVTVRLENTHLFDSTGKVLTNALSTA
jgi:multiple sugar transport system ATP-binding protein